MVCLLFSSATRANLDDVVFLGLAASVDALVELIERFAVVGRPAPDDSSASCHGDAVAHRARVPEHVVDDASLKHVAGSDAVGV